MKKTTKFDIKKFQDMSNKTMKQKIARCLLGFSKGHGLMLKDGGALSRGVEQFMEDNSLSLFIAGKVFSKLDMSNSKIINPLNTAFSGFDNLTLTVKDVMLLLIAADMKYGERKKNFNVSFFNIDGEEENKIDLIDSWINKELPKTTTKAVKNTMTVKDLYIEMAKFLWTLRKDKSQCFVLSIKNFDAVFKRDISAVFGVETVTDQLRQLVIQGINHAVYKAVFVIDGYFENALVIGLVKDFFIVNDLKQLKIEEVNCTSVVYSEEEEEKEDEDEEDSLFNIAKKMFDYFSKVVRTDNCSSAEIKLSMFIRDKFKRQCHKQPDLMFMRLAETLFNNHGLALSRIRHKGGRNAVLISLPGKMKDKVIIEKKKKKNRTLS